jgi:hypothetical protein
VEFLQTHSTRTLEAAAGGVGARGQPSTVTARVQVRSEMRDDGAFNLCLTAATKAAGPRVSRGEQRLYMYSGWCLI